MSKKDTQKVRFNLLVHTNEIPQCYPRNLHPNDVSVVEEMILVRLRLGAVEVGTKSQWKRKINHKKDR
jgi:hypothetical protein